MKTHLIVVSLVFCAQALGQNSEPQGSATPEHKNELGVETTFFIERLLHDDDFYFDIAPYYLTYRRYLDKSSIRAGLGMYYFSQPKRPASFDTVNTEFDHTTFDLSFRLGYEWTSELSKHWQVFYGVDALLGYQHYINEEEYYDGLYARGQEITTNTSGIAPMLGVRFRINDRLSLTTESSWALTFRDSKSQQMYAPAYENVPEKEPDPAIRTKRTSTDFLPPLFLYINLAI